MFQVLLIIQVLLGLGIIGLILLQQGKGADMGAAFGSGSSGTVFGSRGGGSFFTRMTAILAALFFANSVLLSTPLVVKRDGGVSVTEGIVAPDVTEQAPAVDLPPADLPEAPTMEDAAPADMPPPAESNSSTSQPDDLPQ